MSRNSHVHQRSLSAAVAALISVGSFSAHAFDVPVHIRITNGELRPLRARVDGNDKGFSPKALEQIADANEGVDSIAAGSAAIFHSERHFTDENYAGASQRLIDLRREIVQLVKDQSRDGKKARQRLGRALHTLQDFYAHSNWVERGNGAINSALGTSTLSNPSRTSQTCPDNPNRLGPAGGGSLTSGYFVGFTTSPDTFGCVVNKMPANKCFHGNYTLACPGINKDLDATGARQNGVAQNPNHAAAARLGRLATKGFVQGILDELSGNDRALAALLDVRGTLGFVVDDTGSMGSSIAGVAGTISQMVGEVSANPDLAPDNYLLVRFGDPDVGTAFITQDAASLQQAVAALSPSGGGDCPELSQTALITAIGAAAPDSRIYLFTDATAKDSSVVNQVIAIAQAKGTELNYGLTGSCSPIDEAYIRGAAETGGQLFRVYPSEIPALLSVIRPQLKGDLATISRRRVNLGVGGTETITAPVDSHMTGLLVAVTVVENNVPASQQVRLIRPSGAQVSPGEPGVEVVALSSGTIVHITTPEQGEWKVEVEGYGPFTATVQGNSSIDIARFDFVEPGGDIHGGFERIPGQPFVGTSNLGEATLIGPYATAEFNFVDEGGRVLAPIALATEFPTANPEHFLGTTSLPAVPFRVAVRGTDSDGASYNREYPTVYRAQPVQVVATGMPVVTLTPGVQQFAHFTVENRGPSATFRNAASDERGYVGLVTPASMTLGTNEKAEVSVILEAPEDAGDGDSSDVAFTTTNANIPSVFNSAYVVATVVANAPPICPVISSQFSIWPPNGKFASVPVAVLASATDPDGDPVTLSIRSITQDEPVGSGGPDATGIGSAAAQVRAERQGNGNGRVYSIQYTATDSKGASCSGAVFAAVPHDRSGTAAVDDGQRFDSTAP